MEEYVDEGSLILKETRGWGDSVTVLNEEMRRPVGLWDSGLWERMMVNGWGTRRIRARTVLLR